MRTKSIFSLFFLFYLFSCDPVGNLDVSIQNLTGQNIRIQWFSNLEEFQYSKLIEQGETQLIPEQNISDIGSLVTEPYYQVYDSVLVFSSDNELIKTWRPDSTSKNIFNTTSDWELRTIDNWEARAKFTIEVADLD